MNKTIELSERDAIQISNLLYAIINYPERLVTSCDIKSVEELLKRVDEKL